ncbi:MAG TPA: TIGR03067 domain-containing protein [Gemmatales bacterium]|nr:TIGR03067 domain-containing protein [Gemmatales bacterium]HMP61462.1 TIGR03067 domain-containing protein [Gemmatales bacterium]
MLALLLCLVAVNQEPPKPEADPVAQLQGTWRLVQVAYDGKTEKPDFERVFTIQEDRITPSDRVDDVATFKLDATKSPAWIDLTDRGGRVSQGIYRLSGRRLELAMEEGEGPRPETFEAPRQSKSKIVVLVLERARTR